MAINELQQRYNKTLDLINRGSVYMNNPYISTEAKEKAVPAFRKLIDRANNMVYEFERHGERLTENQILEGFTEVSI